MSQPPRREFPLSHQIGNTLRAVRDEDMSRLRILVADPFSQLREIIRDILLRGIGVDEVIDCRNGEEALNLLRDLGADVVLADASMKPLGGIALCKRIRAGVEGIDPYLPVIVMSGRAEISEITAARDAGVNEYLAKPLSAKILDLRLHAVVERPRPFVRSDNFFGPDRRRHMQQGFGGEDRRTEEADLIDPQAPQDPGTDPA